MAKTVNGKKAINRSIIFIHLTNYLMCKLCRDITCGWRWNGQKAFISKLRDLNAGREAFRSQSSHSSVDIQDNIT